MRSGSRVLIGSALFVSAACAGFASCDLRGPGALPDEPSWGGGAGTPYDAGTVDADSDAPSTPPEDGDAGAAPVLVGITPSPRSDRDGGPTADDQLAADLTTFAAGVRGVAITRTLRDLGDDAKEPLAKLSAFYGQHQKAVLFNVAMVDRAADGRPDALVGRPWDDPAVATALQSAIDLVLTSFGSSLSYVTFGRDADVYLARHPGERDAFALLATKACAYAGGHPRRPRALHVGVGLSSDAATGDDPTLGALLEAGDATVLSYVPGLDVAKADPASDVAGALDAMIARAGPRPIVLQAVGYPSATAVGGSEERQRLFFQTFFDALLPRRSAFPFVNVVELHDPSDAACSALTASQGEEPRGAFASFACSLGLFGQGEASKQAWTEVLGGAATFASP